MMLAYEVEIGGLVCIAFAKTRNAAKMAAVLGLREAGYLGRREWPIGSIHVCRLEYLDSSWLAETEKAKCYDPDYVRGYL